MSCRAQSPSARSNGQLPRALPALQSSRGAFFVRGNLGWGARLTRHNTCPSAMCASSMSIRDDVILGIFAVAIVIAAFALIAALTAP
jgi:hypothetical protein